MARPDAVLIALDRVNGDISKYETVDDLITLAERFLGIDPESLEEAWAHADQDGYFVTRDPSDSRYFPETHPLARQPRYLWREGPPGIKIGTYRAPSHREAPPQAGV